MTRFARAKGSKASNERVPEQATSWLDMKKQITDKEDQALDAVKRKEVEADRTQNYKNFLEEEAAKKREGKWSEFPEDPKISKKSNLLKPKNGKVIKKNKPQKILTKAVKKNFVSLLPSNTNETNGSTDEEEQSSKKPIRKNFVSLLPQTEVSDSDDAPEELAVIKTDNSVSKKKKNSPLKSKVPDAKVDNMKKPQYEIIYNKKGHPIKKKIAKIRDNEEHKSRKPDQGSTKIFSNGKHIEVLKYDGFPVMKEDHERLVELKKSLISKGIPKSEVKFTMLKERRRAEKAFAREKKKVCFQCRKSGHVLSECPEVGRDAMGIETSGTGMCFKCGSTEHTHYECKVVRSQEFKFAECFICKEKGHISRQCPDNPRGLYPKGGGCRLCGSVTHLKKDCPQMQQENEEKAITLPMNGTSIEGWEYDSKPTVKPGNVRQNIVKF